MPFSHDDLVARAQEIGRRNSQIGDSPNSHFAIGPISEQQRQAEQLQRELSEREEYRHAHLIRYAWKRLVTGKFYALLCYVFGYLAVLLAASAVLRAFNQT